MRSLLLAVLLLASCGGGTPNPPQPGTREYVHAWIKEKEGLFLGCDELTHEDPAATVDCVLVFNTFNEFRERYAVMVDPAGRGVTMGRASWMQTRFTIDARGVPVMATGAQASFANDPIPFIQWANPHAVGCEALHLFHFVLHGSELRPEALREGFDQYTFNIIGHGTPDDPLLFRCWEDSAARYLGTP